MRKRVLLYAVLALIFAALLGVTIVRAQFNQPEVYRLEDRIGLFQRPDGAWCVVEYRGENYEPWIDCDCPCNSECSETIEIIDPVDPEPNDKPMCNCGGGNGGEDCNPNPNCDEKKNDKHDEN